MNYLSYILLPFVIGIVAMPLLISFSATTKKLVDVAEGDALKIHKKPTSLLGGVGMALGFLTGLPFLAAEHGPATAWMLALGFLIVFCVMLWDDLKWKHITTIRPFLKFPLLLSIALVPTILLSFAGIRLLVVPWYPLSILFGFALVFLVINSVNYQDGMDGLAGGQVLISSLGFALLAIVTGNTLALLLSLLMIGMTAAFLAYNLPPAKIFMGDSGAYSLGFLLAALAFMVSRPYAIYSILGSIFIIGLPVVDGVFTNIRRIVNGKSIFHGDRSHMYDVLMQKGFSVKKTLAICYGIQVVLIAMGIIIYLHI